VGSPCDGALRCRSSFHGDCLAPSCPAGCTFLGWATQVTTDPPGSSGGIFRELVCVGGVWTVQSFGQCHDPKDAICDCPDAGDASDGGS
jgi:hypothetical protein